MAHEALARVGLPDPERLSNEYPYQLSGGMCQRVTIAIATALDPQVIIADEPAADLDVTVRAGIQSGDIVTLKGKGLPSLEGYGRGHQLVRFNVETPRKLTPEARKLFEQLRELESDGQKASHPERQGFIERLYEKFTGKAD